MYHLLLTLALPVIPLPYFVLSLNDTAFTSENHLAVYVLIDLKMKKHYINNPYKM